MEKDMMTLSFINHLAELRKRLIIIFAVNIIGALVCYQFIDKLIQVLLWLNPGMNLIYISPSELFMVYVQLAIICAVVILFPITASQAWAFIAQGLFKKERRYGMIALFAGVFFFILGASFAYFAALPITLDFFLRITLEGIEPMISIDSYISFCTRLLGCFGVAFELPVVVFLLSELEILKPHHMKQYHGILILLIFIISAILTPPDVLTQVIMAVPMCALLQLSMGICWMIDRRKKKNEDRNNHSVTERINEI